MSDTRSPADSLRQPTGGLWSVYGSDLWGDYGDVLIHGLTGTLPEIEGRLQMERTGPYVPPITLPSWDEMVLQDTIKNEMETLALKDVTFQPVIKARIVSSDWETWDHSAAEPRDPPFDEEGNGGEPEDYVLLFPHSEAASTRMGALWQAMLPISGEWEEIDGKSSFGRRMRLYRESWRGHELFLAKKRGSRAYFRVIATGPMRDWLAARSEGWLEFSPVEMA